MGRGLAVWPRHQRTPSSQRSRVARQRERRRTRRSRDARVAETDTWMVLCTTHPAWRAAVASYRRRWATEGSSRDAQRGWELEPVLTQTRSAVQAEAILGLWALGALLQTYLGCQVLQGPPAVQAVAAQWTTTGRLSVWAQGQMALREPLLTAWVAATLRAGAARVAGAPRAQPRPPRTLTAEPAAHPRRTAA